MKMGIRAFLLTVLIAGYAIFSPHSFATDAALLPNGVQQFFDNNGKPLTSGYVYTYEVGTTTLKTTWKDSAGAVANTNPIRLDGGGKAIIYGSGTYRQVVKASNGNLIWDAVTAPGGGGGSTPTNVGDGNSVGTILTWSGLIAPNQYAFAYGQELSRTTYPELYAAITQPISAICTASSNTLSGLSDTTQINIGSPVEASCVAAGTTVVSKTSSAVIMSNAASLNLTTVARFFNYGNGNGTTTFNVPDLRGYVQAGRDNMGGVAASRLTTAYFGSNTPDALGATGGAQSHTLTQAELPTAIGSAHSTVTDPMHSHLEQRQANTGGGSTIMLGAASSGGAVETSVTSTANSPTNITVTTTISNATGGNAHSIVQPTMTLNYVIKTTADTPSSAFNGVASLGGMQGVIACGSGVICVGNTISAIGGGGGAVSFSAGAGITLSPNPLVDVGTIGLTSTIAAGSGGSATQVPVLTYNATGQLTNVVNTTITPAFTSLTGAIACTQYKGLTGDLTSPDGSCATTLATVNSNVGTFGSTTLHPVITVNGKGLITAVTTSTGPTYTSGAPLFGDGTATISAGSITGTGSKVVTSTGSYVNGNCAQWNASGNLIDSGTGCGGGGGSGTVSSGTANQLGYYASTGTTISGLTSGNNGVLVTSAAGVPSISSTIPITTQLNITQTGTITTGTWNATIVTGTYGGTGVNNGSNTITLGGNLTVTPNTVTFTTAGTTNVTLPTSGTLVNSAVTTLSSLTSIGTIGTGVWQGTVVAGQYGGTGVANTGKTITLGGNLTTQGAFNTTFIVSQSNITYIPNEANGFTLAATSGTLTNGDCVSINAGRLVAAGGPCTTGGGGGTVSSGSLNQLGYYASNGTVISGLATGNNGVLITSAGGAPSINSTLPSAVQANITQTGTVASGVWNGTVVGSTYGGTGVNNGSSTLTLAGNVTHSGAFATTFTVTGTTNVTLPTTGTLVNSAVTTLSSLSSIGTVTVGTWQGTKLGVAYGGTNADLSASGGPSRVLQQTSSGGAVSVAQLACADLSNGAASCSTDTTNAANISSGTLPSGRLAGSYTGITGVGTVTAGAWQATPVDINNYTSGNLPPNRMASIGSTTIKGAYPIFGDATGATFKDGGGRINVKAYGALGDTQGIGTVVAITASVSPATLTVYPGSFTLADVGKTIAVPGAGAAGGQLLTTIMNYTSANQVVLAATASTTLNYVAKTITWGTDDTTAFTNCFATNKLCYAPTGLYLTSGGFVLADLVKGSGLTGDGPTLSQTAFVNPSPSTATVTVSIASPGVVTWTAHNLQANTPVLFTTTGALPTGITAGTLYYVKTVLTVNTFTISATAGGTVINTSGSQSGVQTGVSTGTYTNLTGAGTVLLNTSTTNNTIAMGNHTSYTQFSNFTLSRTSTATAGAGISGVNLTQATDTFAITSGTNTLAAGTSGYWTSNDVGKSIQVPGAGVAGSGLVATISALNGVNGVYLSSNASTTVSGSRTVSWNILQAVPRIFNVNSEYSYYGFELGETDYGFLQNSSANYNGSHGVYLHGVIGGGGQWQIDNVIAGGNVGNGFYFYSNISQTSLGQHNRLSTSGNTLSGIAYVGTSASAAIQGIRLNDCFAGDDLAYGVYLDTYGDVHRITNCYVETEAFYGYYFSANNTNVELMASKAIQNGLSGVFNQGSNVAITGGMFSGNGSAGNAYGIFNFGGYATITGVRSGAATAGTQTYGIVTGGTSTAVTYCSSNLRGNATATTNNGAGTLTQCGNL